MPPARVSEPLLFAVAFSFIWLLHAPLLRLPYFWDEAGYFVPAARDLLLNGSLIPHSTLSNAHPPLVMAWLALWWKFSGTAPAVTRTAMLLVAAFALLGVFRLARRVSNVRVAVAATLLTALYPVFFAQSSLAHLDMTAAALTLWGLAAYLERRMIRASLWFALAGLAKETALVAPVVLAAYEVAARSLQKRSLHVPGTGLSLALAHLKWGDEPLEDTRPNHNQTRPGRPLARAAMLLASLLPLAAWLGFHYSRTGHLFGNPEYFRYNLGATLNPLRIPLAFAERVWQLFGYLNMLVLTGAAVLARIYGKESRPHGTSAAARPEPAAPVELVFALIIVAYLVMLAVVGGAVLARYLLPVYPLVIILSITILARRLSWWPTVVGLVAATFIIALFVAPPYRTAPEDDLAYADFVRLHRQAAERIAGLPRARVLTAWPATDELSAPYLGYVSRPLPVVPVENFSLAQLLQARSLQGSYDYVLVFSTKDEPPREFTSRSWERVEERFFDYHRDLPPEAAAEVLGAHLLWEARRGDQWVAILSAGPDQPPQNPGPAKAPVSAP